MTEENSTGPIGEFVERLGQTSGSVELTTPAKAPVEIEFEYSRRHVEGAVARVKSLSIDGIKDRVGYENVRQAVNQLRTMRTGIKKSKLELTENARRFQKEVNMQAEALIALMQPTEVRLKSLMTAVDDEKARIKREKEEAERLAAEEEARKEREAEEARRRAEEERLRKEREAEEERIRKQQEAEHARLEAERKRQEAEDKRLAEERAEIEAEKARLAEEQRKKDEAERAEAERIRQEEEAKQEAVRQKQLAEERERQRAEQAPDREKLVAWCRAIDDVVKVKPTVTTEWGTIRVNTTYDELREVLADLKEACTE